MIDCRYDPTEHKAVIDEYEQLEEARKVVRGQQKSEDTVPGEEHEGEDDEDKYAEDADMPGVEVDTDSRTRITVRNLRIREDTAKYLYNLDPESAYYDPKSRSMHENPFESKGAKPRPEMARFVGENFVRYSGEVSEVNQAQLFAWEANRRGTEVHALAEPTKLEMLKKEFVTRKTGHTSTAKKEILEKYGGEEYINNAPPKELLLAQSEHYVEYDRAGKLLKGEEKPVIKSKYPEDIYPSNHTSVWGSYFDRTTKRWGFACCRSLLKLSYCTGAAGIQAQKESVILMERQKEEMAARGDQKADVSESSQPGTSGQDANAEPESRSLSPKTTVKCDSEKPKISAEKPPSDQKPGGKEGNKCDSESESSSSESEDESGDDASDGERDENEAALRQIRANKLARKRRKRQKLKQTKKQRKDDAKASKRAKRDAEEAALELALKAKKDQELVDKVIRGELDERALPYNSSTFKEQELTPAEMEKYHKQRYDPADPMAKYLMNKDKNQ